jgi:uncharacterized membrane protein YagU involved in acid resistance
MDLLLFARYRRGGGADGFAPWEFSAGITSWDTAPAPAQVGRRLVEGVFERTLSDRHAALVNNITHWAYGLAAGAQFGLLDGSLRRPRVRHGLPFGAAVWATSYVVLPAAGLYEPIWKYDQATLVKDLTAHLLYGATTAAVFDGLLTHRGDPP